MPPIFTHLLNKLEPSFPQAVNQLRRFKYFLLTLAPPSYKKRIQNELDNFDDNDNVHALPDIFHYWSNKYLGPKFQPFGITDPEQFFFLYCKKRMQQTPEQKIKIVSIGSGNCDMEVRLARRLLDEHNSNFTIECMDINQSMLNRGKEFASAQKAENHISLLISDFNNWQPKQKYDIVIANQCLHHVVELENLFSAIQANLAPKGYFITSDMIGKNGHQRWPEALELINKFWKELPEKYHFNQMQKRHEKKYINHDCSISNFEGIRAQDILFLLNKQFNFELFLPFSNIISVFIDRAFGHNFDVNSDWDKNFIDRVNAKDEEAILSGSLKPTQLLAVMCNEKTKPKLIHPSLTPEFCIRNPSL